MADPEVTVRASETTAPPFARVPVAAIALAAVGVLLAVAGRYGYHRDELYFLAAGRHPDWGYPDQPPLVPLLARLISELAPDSLVALRVPGALCAGAVVVVAGLIARELGGGRGAQALSAFAVAVMPVLLAAGHLLSTAIVDVLVWSVVTLLVLRLVGADPRAVAEDSAARPARSRIAGADPRWWLVVGAVLGIGLQNKLLPAFLAGALVLGVAVCGPRQVFRSSWLWAGVAVALAVWAPNLIWQAANGWPQWDMALHIADGGSGTSNSRAEFLALQFGIGGLLPLWLLGLWLLWRRARMFVVAYAVLLIFFLGTGGKAYYMGGLYPLLTAAGAVLVLGGARRTLVAVSMTAVVAAGAVFAVVVFLPVVPAHRLPGTIVADLNYDAGETVGWPQFARQVDALAQRHNTFDVVTANYGEAGALQRFGDPGLRVYSGHNAYWWWGAPPDRAAVLVVGYDKSLLDNRFGSVTAVGVIDNGLGLGNDEQGAEIYLCRDPKDTWHRLWLTFKHY